MNFTISPISSLAIDWLNDTEKFFELSIFDGTDTAISMMNANFAEHIGQIAFETILRQPFLYLNFSDHEDLYQVALLNNEYADAVFCCLWIIKDNSVFSTHCYSHNGSTNMSASNTRNVFYSNSAGKYETTQFTTDDFIAANKYHEILDSLMSKKARPTVEERTTVHNGIHTIKSNVSSVDYNNYNRIHRSWLFLQAARSTSLLPLKIANYMAILECLFTTDNIEVSHKITERVMFYLGGDKEEKKRNFELIKLGYSVRSKYMHGQLLDNKSSKLEQLIDISQCIDSLIRKVIFKVIMEDSGVFLRNNDDLIAYFQEQLFGN